ncbi:hypothetical protein [Marinicrinis sediminis]|uniref:Uncharacterized protein n=1 Tax=Marinicrinis sediminis TaxID=1652465 RepID=A0ABW5RE81_9BACL
MDRPEQTNAGMLHPDGIQTMAEPELPYQSGPSVLSKKGDIAEMASKKFSFVQLAHLSAIPPHHFPGKRK